MSTKELSLTCNGGPYHHHQSQQQELYVVKEDWISFLDLPELVMDCILEKLPPRELCTMTSVSTCLRERCTSDYFWEEHMNQKWSKIIGSAAYEEWKLHVATRNDHGNLKQVKQNGIMKLLSMICPISWLKPKDNYVKAKTCLPADSMMSWYLALESGNFSFPAQVYNRENGHVGFMLSCYDAEVSYEPRTDTFEARYPPHGSRPTTIENAIPWERLRAPPVDIGPHDLHISDYLNELRPGDHIEIQWRRNKEFPYGWWYGVVGHLESCDGNEMFCRCHDSDALILEFNQYTRGSQWRCVMINRKDHREEGNETDGFYGGIIKLNSKQEIERWELLWPTKTLE